MAATLSEEVRKRKVADALNGQDESADPDPEQDTSDVQSGDEDTGTTADVGEKPAPAEEEAVDQEAVSSAAAEKGPRLGYRFVPVSPPATSAVATERPAAVPTPLPESTTEKSTQPPPGAELLPYIGSQSYEQKALREILDWWAQRGQKPDVPVSPPAQDVPQNVPRGTFLGEEGADVSPALTSTPVYSTPIEEGNQQYVIDQATGAKIPRAQLATSEDIAAQPPREGAEMQRVSVEGQVPRATLVDPDPDEQYVSNPVLANKVKRAQLVDPDPDNLYLPPGTEGDPDAQRAALIGRAIKRAALVDPDPDQQYLAAASELERPPKAQRALGYKFVPVPGAGPVTARAIPAGAAQPIQKALQLPGAQPAGDTTGEANYFAKRGDDPIRSSDDPRLTAVTAGGQNWRVNKEAAPAFQGFLSDLEAAGAPLKSDGGWVYRNIAGTNKLSEHSWGGAIDVSSEGRNQVTPEFRAWMKQNPGTLAQLEQKWHIYGGERFGDLSHFEWGGKPLSGDERTGQAVEKPQAPQAQPVTKQANGLYQNEKPEDFLSGKTTTFATPDDIASGQDNGVGAPRLGRVDTTQIAGVAIPEEALRAKYGNNYAAWRRARVDVVDPQTGKRLRVPIVDLGPRGDQEAITDMTPTLSNYFGGDKNLMVKLVDNAGPDVMKNPQLFADEQAAIKQGFDSSAVQPGVQKIQPKLGYSFKPQTPEGAAQAQKDLATAIKQQQDTISKLPEASSDNVIGLYKRLDQPVEGTSAQSRQAVQANLKPQIIALMRQKFPELKTDDEAWTKATSDVNPLDVGREWITKAIGYGQQFTNVMQKGVAGTDQLHVNQFLEQALPGTSDQEKHAFLSQLYQMNPAQRAQIIQAYLPQQQAGIPSTDPQQIVSALDRLSDPNFQKQQATDLAKAKAEMQRNVSDDPRLAGTGMEKVIDATAQMPAFLAAFSNPVMMPVALAQVSDQVRETFRAQHPEWSEKELQDKSAYATLVQFYGQEAAMRIMTAGGGALLGAVESPAKRAIAQAIAGAGGTAAVGAGAQAATNIIAGEPITKGVGEAALSGAIQGSVAGLVHGAGELRRPGVEPVRPVTERPPVTGEETQPGPTPVKPTEEARPPVSGEQPQAGPVTREDVERRAYEISQERERTGAPGDALSDWHQAQQELANASPTDQAVFTTSKGSTYVLHDDGTTTRNKAYRPEHGLAEQGPQARSEQTFFVTPDDAQKLGEIQARGGPQSAIAQLPDGRYGLKYMEGADAGKFERRSVVNVRRAPEVGLIPVETWENGKTAHFGNEITQVRPAPPRAVGESEPWVSAIANRFTAERMATGDLGPVEPGQGVTTEEMLARGRRMTPEQINQHVSDLMHGVGDPRAQAAAIRTEEARLSQVSHNASLASEADPSNQQARIAADNAFKDLTDFHNGPVAKLKNNWHAQGMTLQGEIPVDLSTFNGLREAFLKDVGKPPPDSMEPVLRKTAQRVRDASAAEAAAMKNLGAEIERKSARRRLPSDEEVRLRIMERTKDMPCRT